MALILNIETSSSGCSIALHNKGELMAFTELNQPQSAASRLAVMINDILNLNGLKAKSLDAVAVSKGPGSYTGLRIGVSTAKGMCLAVKIPLISVDTLPLMARQVAPLYSGDFLFCPMLDARRMEVYTMLLNSKFDILEKVNAKVLDENSYDEWLTKNRILFFGDGSTKYIDVLKNERAVFIPDVKPSAAKMGEVSFLKFANNEFEDLRTFEPFYLKDFVVKKPKQIV
ncbi:MAG: tRNA (adenosine(37)-N6)-threonylcarbamoyltransferase complex dimerization subunit type 1 TsaB [Flammeovirgaceae bacterium]|nr:tRNA (adenosine(37)-N6)-threonylcarbamoyltransferase complex dimerization subunit type 1 TsaB [Flammeovirgaceae bacterium]